jgi:hypothetical protein
LPSKRGWGSELSQSSGEVPTRTQKPSGLRPPSWDRGSERKLDESSWIFGPFTVTGSPPPTTPLRLQFSPGFPPFVLCKHHSFGSGQLLFSDSPTNCVSFRFILSPTKRGMMVSEYSPGTRVRYVSRKKGKLGIGAKECSPRSTPGSSGMVCGLMTGLTRPAPYRLE